MAKPTIYIMGISGSGKSTIGKLLSDETGIPFFDADDFHPVENIERMHAGIPLEDEDRIDWLDKIAAHAREQSNRKGSVIACSALKERYREILNAQGENIYWVYLYGDKDLIRQRMKLRVGHFMPAELLDTQILALEEPGYGLHINVQQSPEQIVQQIRKHFKL